MGSTGLEDQGTLGKLGRQQESGWMGTSPGSHVEPLIDCANPPASGPLLIPLSFPVF